MRGQSLDRYHILLRQRWEGFDDFSRRHTGFKQFEHLFD
jgi:hypothetical protein